MNEDKQPTDAQWTYRPEEVTAVPSGEPAATQPVASEPVSWTASEFIAHHKDSGWYATVAGGALLLCAITWLVTRDAVSVIAIGIVTVLFMIVSSSKPRQQQYSIDSQGIGIGAKFYPYSDFKSFAVHQEGAIGSISFIPLKRFMPEITIYYAPEHEDQIFNVLSQSLPHDQRAEKVTDQLMKRLRF
jgi:hypothetical protein